MQTVCMRYASGYYAPFAERCDLAADLLQACFGHVLSLASCCQAEVLCKQDTTLSWASAGSPPYIVHYRPADSDHQPFEEGERLVPRSNGSHSAASPCGLAVLQLRLAWQGNRFLYRPSSTSSYHINLLFCNSQASSPGSASLIADSLTPCSSSATISAGWC